MADTLPITHTFPKTSESEWMSLVTAILKGKDFESLIHKSEDGIIKGPLKQKQDRPHHLAPMPRKANIFTSDRPWHISAPVEDPDLSYANERAKEDLLGGASTLRILTCLTDKTASAERGVTLRNGSDLKRLLSGIHTDLIPLTFAPSRDVSARLTALESVPDLQKTSINIGLTDTKDDDAIIQTLDSLPKLWRLLTVDTASLHDAGASDALELAFMCAKMTEFMRALGPKRAAQHIIIEMAADQDGHQLIAKMRAARRLCARIKESFGLTDTSVEIHAITSKRMMQSIDPWTNFLRLTSAIFGAVCGGADTITARPFTDAIGLPTPFGHRTARNIQLLLMEESQLGQVQDPAFGSYFHEHLSDAIANIAWTLFQNIETAGGLKAYTQSGALSTDVAKANTARDARDAPILGVTLHTSDTPRAAKVRAAKS